MINKFLVVGLGNPGEQYNKTRHNAGFMCLEKFNLDKNKKFGINIFYEKNFENKKIYFLKPMTYMNSSGTAVLEFINFYKIKIENILIIFDDISLPVGKIRIRLKGSHGGHNGMRNIIEMLQTDKIKRIKIGVGNKPDNWDLDDCVLSKFRDEEMTELEKAINNSIESIKLILENKELEAMNLFN